MRKNNQMLHAYGSTVNALKDIIQRCHQRHNKSLLQRKTIVTPALDKGRLYHFTALCAYKYPVRLYELERAGISFMPIGAHTSLRSRSEEFWGRTVFETATPNGLGDPAVGKLLGHTDLYWHPFRK